MPHAVADRLLEYLGTLCAFRLKRGETLQPSTPLFSSRLIDSMGVVELLAFAEREFGVILNVTLEELTEMDTAARLAERIEQLRQVQQHV